MDLVDQFKTVGAARCLFCQLTQWCVGVAACFGINRSVLLQRVVSACRTLVMEFPCLHGNCQVKTRKIQTKNNDEGSIDGREYSVQEFKSRLRTTQVQHVNDFFWYQESKLSLIHARACFQNAKIILDPVFLTL
jgi:hypothetical protein